MQPRTDVPARVRASDIAGASRAREVPPGLVLAVVQVVAAVVVLVAERFGAIAVQPVWAYVGVIGGSSLLSRRMDRWSVLPPGSWRLHCRVGIHALTVASVIYLTGWGPALGVCFVYAGLVDLASAGARTWRAVLGWSVFASGLGQLAIAIHWMPSFLDGGAAQGLGWLGVFAFAIVIRMAGAIGISKERAEGLLKLAVEETQRSEAHHRAVVENAAEGIITVGLDATVKSFNASAEAIFGWAASDVIGRSVAELVPAELHQHLREFLDRDAPGHAGLQRQGVEVTGARRDGSLFPMSLSTSLIDVPGASPVISAIVRDLSHQKRLEAQLAFQSSHDPLTGLMNRLPLTDLLSAAVARSVRHGQLCCVLYIDLDRFKAVNDTLGHAAGDRVLVEAAARIRSLVREADTVARPGGDEFVVVCENVETVRQATELARRLIDALQVPFDLAEGRRSISASVGIAVSSDASESADGLLVKADIAMYRAKEDGRGRYELFDAEMQRWISGQDKLEADLREALVAEEFRLHAQSVVDLSDGRTVGFEALLRWARPGLGLTAPATFIPVAEETGLILDIGGWVLDEACRHAARWAERVPESKISIVVNVASRQLVAGDLFDRVVGVLARTGLDPALLVLEITESTLIDDPLSVQPLLCQLRDLGVSIALDDFGTGYSSLTYLRSFPINIVKIDRSFVKSVGSNAGDAAIVAAIIELAGKLGIAVIAEGVETAHQLAVLRELGCPFAQGFLFSRPRPIAEVATAFDMSR